MTEAELIDFICKNPDSLYAQCYRLGRKLANLELIEVIRKNGVKRLREIIG
jgi:hypothetical protein